MAGPNNTLGSPWPPLAIRDTPMGPYYLQPYGPMPILSRSLYLLLALLYPTPKILSWRALGTPQLWGLRAVGAAKPWGPLSLKGPQA
jgi:hypothetical protein